MRQVVLDTETTGLQTSDGHRIIEIGCLELINRKPTGRHFHQYINPEREIDAGAVAVHGLNNAFLQDKPVFLSIVAEFMQFIDGAELIIHNAAFDVGFINYELALTKQKWKPVADYCRILDTLKLARELHVGQRNSLDALCKRYSIDNSKREFHGALLDAHLLAQVYLAMTGGQGSLFDAWTANPQVVSETTAAANTEVMVKRILTVVEANAEEINEHEQYLAMIAKKTTCQWLA